MDAVDDAEEHDAEGQALGQDGGQEDPHPDCREEPAQGGAGRPPQRSPALTQAAVHPTSRGRAPSAIVTLPRDPLRPEASRGAADHRTTSTSMPPPSGRALTGQTYRALTNVSGQADGGWVDRRTSISIKGGP